MNLIRMDINYQYPIFLDYKINDDIVSIDCGHKFCKFCVKKWKKPKRFLSFM